jgi:hypothetical protein
MISRFQKYLGTDLVPELLAIIPPGAQLSLNSSVDPKNLGKVPGSYNRHTEAWAGRKDWLEGVASDAMIREWSNYPDPNVGIRAKYFPGVDFDIDLDWLVQKLLPIAERHLGCAPVRGRGGSSRVMLMYRLADGAEPIHKYCLKFTLPETGDAEHAIEILGDGQSYVLEGCHVKGGQYAWKDGIGPVDYGPEKLSAVTIDKLREFVAAVKDELAAIGAKLISSKSSDVGLAGDGGRRCTIGDPALIWKNRETLKKAIELIPCEEIHDREAWLKLVVAAKAGCGGDEEFFEDVLLPWCRGYQKNTDKDVRKIWDSINAAGLGARYIFRIAREYDPSFCDDAQEIFASRQESFNCQSAPLAAPPPAPKSGEYIGPVPKLMPADFALHRLPRRQYVLGYRFMAGAVSLGVGPPGTGKSILSILTALSIATGQPLTDEPVHRSGKVWIHNNEDSLDELYRRVGGVLKHHGIEFSAVRENVFVTSGLDEPLLVAVKERDLVKRTAAVASVIASVQEMGIIHIAIDPLVSTHRGVSENSNEEIEQVAEAIRHIAHETGCSIDLIHHSLKPPSRNNNSEAHAGDMNAARGASSLIGAVRIVYTVSAMSSNTAQGMGLPPPQAVRMLRLDHGKGNYSARDPSIRWFELVTVPIGNGAELFGALPIGGDTVAVPVPWRPSEVDPAADGAGPRNEDLKEAERQKLRDFVARTMETDRVELAVLIQAVRRERGVGRTTARKRVKEAIPADCEVAAQANGAGYLLKIEQEEPCPPGKIFVVRRPARSIADDETGNGSDLVADQKSPPQQIGAPTSFSPSSTVTNSAEMTLEI